MSPERRAAFFDIDNTLFNVKSMFSFQEYFYRRSGAHDNAYAEFVAALQAHPQAHDRLILNRVFYQSFQGRAADDVRQAAQEWFSQLLERDGEALWIRSAVALARTLAEEGYALVAVSGSSHEILEPVLAHLRFDHCLATTLDIQDGCYTGNIVAPQTIGAGKAAVVRDFAQRHGMNLQHCVACGDHLTDMPMLETVGMPYVVAGDPALEVIAAARQWPILPCIVSPGAADQAIDLVHV